MEAKSGEITTVRATKLPGAKITQRNFIPGTIGRWLSAQSTREGGGSLGWGSEGSEVVAAQEISSYSVSYQLTGWEHHGGQN